MNHDKVINVGLLSHYFTDNNLGCVALSICNIKLIDRAAEENGLKIHYIIYINEKQPEWKLDFTDTIDGCDIVFNLCAGDGFTDIYGFGRVLSESYMSILARKKGTRVVLAPQTIGPFRKPHTRAIAKYAMKGCEQIFTRDEQSTDFCRELKYKKSLNEVIDVAFALPFEVVEQAHDKINIGLNVSGLLYNGGYDYKNYFGLSFNYKEYVESLIERLLKENYNVHLISHVITKDGSIEDDFVICKQLSEKYPQVVLMPRSESPIEVKSYIAGMDVFIGARMHSTIGAFSAGIPVIPVAYSRKFNGLFNTLEYPYYIDAKADITKDAAVEKTLEWIEKRSDLSAKIKEGKKIYSKRLDNYVNMAGQLLKSVN